MTGTPPILDAATSRRYRWRLLNDQLARYWVGIGGISVIFAIALIFFYLFYVVLPLLVPASAEETVSYAVPGGGTTLHLEMEELNQQAVRYTTDGRAIFFTVRDGTPVGQVRLPVTDVRSFATGAPGSGLVALGLGDGRALVLRHVFKVSYPGNVRTITPAIEYPYGEEPLVVDEDGRPLTRLAVRDSEERLTLLAASDLGPLVLADFTKESSFLEDAITLERTGSLIDPAGVEPKFMLVGPQQRRLFVAAEDGELLHFEVRRGDQVRLVERIRLLPEERELTVLRFLAGGNSLLAGDSGGRIAQWFPVRDPHNRHTLQHVRSFDAQDRPVIDIAVEERRKGFAAVDAAGRVGLYHTTAERTLLVEQVGPGTLLHLSISPRADHMLIEDADGRLHLWQVENEHPEVSWHSLWEKVHYEGYGEPAYIWQSSSASNDFEPKFSLVPLSFGTIKAAFYAMLVAVPLAIMGAIYTAYFMAPRMRQMVKPSIEIMEALPTVILGFLAGLWLAPMMESHLPGIFALLLMMPLGLLVFAFAWRHMPQPVRRWVPNGWEAALLIPVVLFLGWLSFALSAPLEQGLFGGDMRGWLHTELGIGFDQRNSLVVGLAMGFAVIPTIFSITEDAIFSVPKHLTFGSLALGATPWQTLSRVVILTASPGIFSAVMIGLGRAVGETMIVLMATGNTPVMDFSIFQGMRTLSANIAVEMPESEVASTHYRILFLAALVLFMFTFIFNTVAELIRQRLRRRYASL